jgi:hypothetical protein
MIRKIGSGELQPQSGLPELLDARSALSAAILTTFGGRDTQFSEVELMADWDGREDCTADHSRKVDDFSLIEPEPDVTLTRTAISEHTIANGFNENIFYYGDSAGNVWVGADTNGDGRVDLVQQLNLPTLLTSPFPPDDEVTITGLAVSPVVDVGLPSAAEVLWGTFTDSEGVISGTNIFRSVLFFVLITDDPDVAFPITIQGTGVFSLSTSSSVGGVAVDDNGDVYWSVADLLGGPNAGRILKAWDLDSDRFPDFGFAVYSGNSTTFGNIVAITNGPCNTIYAAVSRSFVATDDPLTQTTEGLFTNPAALGPTPSMIISFADCSGDFNACSGIPEFNVGGQIPIADEFADVAVPGQALVPGVNNFRVFALGNGPDIRPAPGVNAISTSDTLKVDMQIDYSAHAGIAVDENATVYVISGGEPAGVGKNPSPMVGEILCFEDSCPADRRADFVDFRGNAVPNPPASGGNVGDGDSDRFDHIWAQAPIDQVTLTPTGLAGLARGFLRYTNRLAPNPMGPGVTLGVTDQTQGDDDTDGTIFFGALDPGHQAGGGDDLNSPSRGDDANSDGTPVLLDPLSGGFEFVFGGTGVAATCVWNGFFLNSNGNITFGAGDTDNTPSVPEFRAGLPKIAPAWADLNPAARSVSPTSFPVQAIGFSGVNSFKIRWINVPEFGFENCGGLDVFGLPQNGLSNTFSITLFDDGTGLDENTPVPQPQEGPTDLRFTREPNTGTLVGCPPRREGSGIFTFEYCRMDLLGTPNRPVLVGYSIGGLNPLNPPGLCEINLSEAARAADTNPFGVIQGTTAAIGCGACCIGEGTEPTLFEFFENGSDATISSGGLTTFATPDFDLRF